MHIDIKIANILKIIKNSPYRIANNTYIVTIATDLMMAVSLLKILIKLFVASFMSVYLCDLTHNYTQIK